MFEYQPQKTLPVLPFKSVAGALLFSVILGPVGLLYSSSVGGILLILVGFVFLSKPTFVLMIFLWTLSCIWSVLATNRFNKKILKTLQ